MAVTNQNCHVHLLLNARACQDNQGNMQQGLAGIFLSELVCYSTHEVISWYCQDAAGDGSRQIAPQYLATNFSRQSNLSPIRLTTACIFFLAADYSRRLTQLQAARDNG